MIVAPRLMSWTSTDLSQPTVNSEIIDLRDLKSVYGVMTTTSNPTGSMKIVLFFGLPAKTAAGLDWSLNDTLVIQTISLSGTASQFQIGVSSFASAFQFQYTRTSGSGTVRAFIQSKTSTTL